MNPFNSGANWVARPGQLVSLYEIMRRFNSSRLASLQFALGQMHQLTKYADGDHGPSLGSIQALTSRIEQAIGDCTDLGLTFSLRSLRLAQKIAPKALEDAFVNGSGDGWQYLNRVVFDAGTRVEHELSERMLFVIPGDKVDLFESTDLFGVTVADAFPSSNFDIAEAGKCLGLGRSTAAVMHLMRALETPMQAMAREFSIPIKKDNWHDIIKNIEKAVIALDPKTDADKQTFFSGACSHFRFIKDAWRNHVMHAREKYTEEDADNIFRSVKAFMGQLSKRLKE